MSERRVLVTGATGFLGVPLAARLLREGWSVTGLSRGAGEAALPAGAEPLAADLTDPAAARAALAPWRWDAVVHLAGPAPKGTAAWHDGAALIATHARAAANLRAAFPPAWEGRLVHASGFIVYGVPERLPVAEDHVRAPLHAYALAKVLVEDLFLAGGAGALDRWILRLPGLFSEGRREGALYRFAVAAGAGEPLLVQATQPLPWDVLHVEDAVEAVVASLDAAATDPGPVNVGYGEAVELSRIARWMAERGGRGSVVRAVGPEHPPFAMDVSRARRLLGWNPPALRDRLDGFFAAAVAA